MADSTTQTYTNVNDLPDYAKPYYKMLLNAVSGITFDPNYVASQIGSSSGSPATALAPVLDAGGSPVQIQYPYVPSQAQSPATAPNVPNTVFVPSAAPSQQDGSLTFGGGREASPSQLIQQNVDNILNSGIFRRPVRRASGGAIPTLAGGIAPLVNSQLGGGAYNQ